MVRTRREASLDNRTNRLRLKPRHEPYWATLSKGEHLGYYRTKAGGTWIAKWRSPSDGCRLKESLGIADDFQPADGAKVLDWKQAQKMAFAWFETCLRKASLRSSGDSIAFGKYTVADALMEYLEDARRKGQKGTKIAEQVINARIKPDLGHIEVSKLGAGRIRAWHLKLSQSGRQRTGKTRTEPTFQPAPKSEDEKRARKNTANRILAILKRALNLALENQRVSDGREWQVVKPFKGVMVCRVRFLSTEEVTRFLNVCAPDFRKLVHGALATGARYGELAKLRVMDFNLKAGTVFIADSKSGKPRHIVITDEGKTLFRNLTEGRNADELIFQRDSVKRVLRKELGQAWGHTDQASFMESACEESKLGSFTFHELRHTYASMLVNAGCPLVYVAAQLGHADTRMVEKFYGHMAPTALAEAIRTLMPKLGLVQPDVKALEIQTRGA